MTATSTPTVSLIRRASGTLLLAGALLLVQPNLSAQSVDRVALIEEVTSASCGPCEAQNPAFRALLDANLDNVAVIRYQRGGGSYVDPMWSFNPSQVDYRIASYYGTFSFPQTWTNGEYTGTPSTVNQTAIDAAFADPAWWDIAISQEYDASTKEMVVDVTFTALRDMLESTDNYLRAHVVLVEDEINYTSPPGYNNEKDFYSVMRTMYPGGTGINLGQQTTGQEEIVSFRYAVDESVIDPSRLTTVAFVQTLTTQDVHQAAIYRESTPSGIENPVLSDFSLSPTLADQLITLSFSLLDASEARIDLYDINGRLVETLLQENLPAGNQQRSFVLPALAAGTYMSVLRAGDEQRIARFVVAR